MSEQEGPVMRGPVMDTTLSRCAILTFDPGGKTGVAMGWFNLEYASIKDCIRRAKVKHSLRAYELAGTPIAQSIELQKMYDVFVFRSNVELGLPLNDIHVVIEDFHARKQTVDLAPVKITSGFEARIEKSDHGKKSQTTHELKKSDHVIKVQTVTAMNVQVKPVKQMPAEAMGFATNQRLREWGAWIVGSEHARDAMRHLCVKLSKLLG